MKKLLKNTIKAVSVLALMFQVNEVIKRKSDTSIGFNSLSTSDLFYNCKYGNIRYQVRGKSKTNKPKIVLVHSLMIGGSINEFYELANILKEEYEVYAFDMLGFGLSDKPNISYNSYLYVSIINDFINDVVGGKASIVASNDSADFICMLRQFEPNRLEDVFLINPKGATNNKFYGNIGTVAVKNIMFLPIIGTFISNVLSSKFNIKMSLLKDGFYNPTIVNSKTVCSFYKYAHYKCEDNRYALSHLCTNFLSVNTKPELLDSEYKTNIILSECTNDFDAYALKDLLSTNKNNKLEIIPLCKNLVATEKPYEVYKFIKANKTI